MISAAVGPELALSTPPANSAAHGDRAGGRLACRSPVLAPLSLEFGSATGSGGGCLPRGAARSSGLVSARFARISSLVSPSGGLPIGSGVLRAAVFTSSFACVEFDVDRDEARNDRRRGYRGVALEAVDLFPVTINRGDSPEPRRIVGLRYCLLPRPWVARPRGEVHTTLTGCRLATPTLRGEPMTPAKGLTSSNFYTTSCGAT